MQKNTSSVKLTQEVIRRARMVDFPLYALPDEFVGWLNAMAGSRNTKAEFILLSSLAMINTILGPRTKLELRAGSKKSTVVHKREGHHETPGLFITILSEPGSGKTNAYDVAIQQPLKNQDDELLESIVIQDYTKKGLFEALSSHNGRGILASPELQNFFDNLMRKQLDGYGERTMFNNLYDGSGQWIMTSAGRKSEGGKSKREELEENSFSIVGFSQPEPFIQDYRPMALVRDGFVDRLLVCTVKPNQLYEHEVDYWVEQLDRYSLQSFHSIYNQVYTYHKDVDMRYRLDKEAQAQYISYSNNIVKEMNSCWENGEINSKNYSKDKRNLARISLGLHVLVSVVTKFLSIDTEDAMVIKENEIPLEIDVKIFQTAETIISYFRQQREILNMVFESKVKPNLSSSDLANFLLGLVKKENFSEYLLSHKDGFVLRVVPDINISESEIKDLLESKGFRKTTKAYYFQAGRLRGYMLPWGLFDNEDLQRLKQSIQDKSSVEKQTTGLVDLNAKASTAADKDDLSTEGLMEKGLSFAKTTEELANVEENCNGDLSTEELMERGLLFSEITEVLVNAEEDCTEFQIEPSKKAKLDIVSPEGTKTQKDHVSKELLKLKDYWNEEIVTSKRVRKNCRR